MFMHWDGVTSSILKSRCHLLYMCVFYQWKQCVAVLWWTYCNKFSTFVPCLYWPVFMHIKLFFKNWLKIFPIVFLELLLRLFWGWHFFETGKITPEMIWLLNLYFVFLLVACCRNIDSPYFCSSVPLLQDVEFLVLLYLITQNAYCVCSVDFCLEHACSKMRIYFCLSLTRVVINCISTWRACAWIAW